MATKSKTTQRKLAHKYIDLISDAHLPEVEMILQQYAAIELNRKHQQEQTSHTA